VISYDAASREFSIPSENDNVDGNYELRITAELQDYPNTHSNVHATLLNVFNLCEVGTPTLTEEFPFSDHTMTLTDPEYSIEWTVE
jgi:hypothetical protein